MYIYIYVWPNAFSLLSFVIKMLISFYRVCFWFFSSAFRVHASIATCWSQPKPIEVEGPEKKHTPWRRGGRPFHSKANKSRGPGKKAYPLKKSWVGPGPSEALFGILRGILRVYFWVYFWIMDGMSDSFAPQVMHSTSFHLRKILRFALRGMLLSFPSAFVAKHIFLV